MPAKDLHSEAYAALSGQAPEESRKAELVAALQKIEAGSRPISNGLLKAILVVWWLFWAAIFASVVYILWNMDSGGRP